MSIKREIELDLLIQYNEIAMAAAGLIQSYDNNAQEDFRRHLDRLREDFQITETNLY